MWARGSKKRWLINSLRALRCRLVQRFRIPRVGIGGPLDVVDNLVSVLLGRKDLVDIIVREFEERGFA